MNLTNIHKSLLLFFALCSFASFVFLFQFNTTNGVLAELESEDTTNKGQLKFGLHYIESTIYASGAATYDKLYESPELKNACSSREKLADLTTAATYVTIVFCISLFSVFFFVLEKDELSLTSLTSKSIGLVIILIYVADVALHGVMFSENDSFYHALKENSADPDSWNQGQSMLYIGGSLICHLVIPGVILIGFFGYLISLIYSYCKKNNGYTGVA